MLQELWKQLAVDQVLKKLLRERKFQSPVERAIFAMVANRALAPMSKRAVEECGFGNLKVDQRGQ